MNDERNTITFTRPDVQPTAQASSPIRAKFFKVTSANQNYDQYLATIRAYAQAGMPFGHIANAGQSIGDQVEKGEIDSSLIEGWQEKAGEIAEGDSKVLAWQNREVISVTHQLPSSATSGQDVVPLAQNLATQSPQQNMNVLEGIAVYNQNPQSLPNVSTQTQNLENNPFLSAPPVIKKAA